MLLRLEHVSLAVERGLRSERVVRDASLELDRGRVGLVCDDDLQESWTLLRMAAGLERPDTGRVLLRDEDISSPDSSRRQRRRLQQRLRRQIAWASNRSPQTPELTVLDLVAMPQHRLGLRRAHSCARSALRSVGAHECADAYWHHLSPAEATRVAIARATTLRPDLIVFADPIGSLGVADREITAVLLRQIADEDGCGVLFSAVDGTGLGTHVDDIWIMESGALIAVEPVASDEARSGGTILRFPKGGLG